MENPDTQYRIIFAFMGRAAYNNPENASDGGFCVYGRINGIDITVQMGFKNTIQISHLTIRAGNNACYLLSPIYAVYAIYTGVDFKKLKNK